MIKKISGHRLVSLLSLVSLLFVAGGFFWAIGSLSGGAPGPLILHFNDMQGITAIGDFNGLLLMGILGLIVVVINFFIALDLEVRDNVLGKIVATMTLVMAILLFLACASIIKVN
jgi:hypothetical protein